MADQAFVLVFFTTGQKATFRKNKVFSPSFARSERQSLSVSVRPSGGLLHGRVCLNTETKLKAKLNNEAAAAAVCLCSSSFLREVGDNCVRRPEKETNCKGNEINNSVSSGFTGGFVPLKPVRVATLDFKSDFCSHPFLNDQRKKNSQSE